ncbi:hypothetical protein MBLNU230_g7448t2 [Neophaeotheca triangularis]
MAGGIAASVTPLVRTLDEANRSHSGKKSLNVASPSFTPRPVNAPSTDPQVAKPLGISPRAAAAAAFTPRGSGSVTPAGTSHSKEPSGEFIPDSSFQPQQPFQEFVPQSFLPQSKLSSRGALSSQDFFATDSYGHDQGQSDQQQNLQTAINPYSDPFMSAQAAGLDGIQTQINPYASAASTAGSQAFFQDTTSFKHPLNYHLYAAMGPYRQNLQPYQRTTNDFFLDENLREDLQRKSEATLQTFANSTLPPTVEHFHSLVALDIGNQKSPLTFGYPSHIYKATSSKDGNFYTLRRISGFRLSDAAAIKTISHWKRINSGSVVKVHDAFTTRLFGDTSLMVVADYFPLSQNLQEKYFGINRGLGPQRGMNQPIPESELWGYIAQLSQALRVVHAENLAARTVMLSKILLTSKNRVRLNGCGVFDIVQYGTPRSVQDLQRADLQDLGRVILALATKNQATSQNVSNALDQVGRIYSDKFRACLRWLLSPPQTDLLIEPRGEATHAGNQYSIRNFMASITDELAEALDSCLQSNDDHNSQLMRELENGRISRLMIKLGVILERPEYSLHSAGNPPLFNQSQQAWSEVGERYYLKLFRDYVFHQVDHEGRPVLNLGHIIQCLNKLDAGVDENIQLVSRDERDVIVASYKEIKRGFENAWNELVKAGNASKR